MQQSGIFSGGVGPWRDRVGTDLEALRPRFWDYTPPDRDHERRGLLAWDSDIATDCRAHIQIAEHPEHGFAVLWVIKTPQRKRSQEFFTVGDRDKLNNDDWIDASDEEWVLKGNFVPLETAWAVIEDFFADPLTPSHRAEWIDTDEMPEFPI